MSSRKQNRIQARETSAQSGSRRPFIIGMVAGLAFAVISLVLLAGVRREPQVLEIIPTSGLDELYRPLDERLIFDPEQRFYVAVQLKNYRTGQPLQARWYYAGEEITTTSLETNTTGSGWAGFELRNNNPPWPEGLYTVEIIWKEEVLGYTSFRVN